ncbi:MAG: MFS transporter [Desulfobacterales bacterium]|jgi:MFS family permease|nr:MFS transporter [Desulfobacterales bacterium]
MKEHQFVKYSPALMLSVIYMFSIMDRNIISIVLDLIKKDLHLSDFELALMSGLAFAFFYGVMGIPIGHLADRKNRVSLITICLSVWSLMTILSGLAVNFLMLVVARMGVGIGEAGCAPSAHSIMVDIYKPIDRGKVMAIYHAAQPFGTASAMFVGGWLADAYGWRITLITIGLPGLLLAVAAKLWLKEPVRPEGNKRENAKPGPTIWQTITLLLRNKLFRTTCMAHIACVSFMLSIITVWLPTVMHRSLELSFSQIGMGLGIVSIISGIFGTLASGPISDRLYKKDARWLAYLPAIFVFLATPFFLFAMTTKNLTIFYGCVTCVYVLIFAHTAPCFALIHHSVDSSIRAMTIAIVILLVNFFGMGICPSLIGFISDMLHTDFGVDSLRIGILCAVILLPVGGLFFLYASRLIVTDENGDIKTPQLIIGEIVPEAKV